MNFKNKLQVIKKISHLVANGNYTELIKVSIAKRRKKNCKPLLIMGYDWIVCVGDEKLAAWLQMHVIIIWL